MYSLSESTAKKALKKTRNEFLAFNEDHLSRVYPNSTRINSSNYNPAYYWMHGCQMVALNYQSNGGWGTAPSPPHHNMSVCMSLCTDTPMHHNIAMFQQNGGAGYIPKPQVGYA